MAGFFGSLRGSPGGRQNARMARELRGLVRSKKYREALKVGTAYLQRVPENHDVQFIVGSIHYMQHRYRTAISFFDRALEIGSYDVEVLILKAHSHHALGENGRAAKCCGRIREVDPGNRAASELLSKIGAGG